MKKYLLTCLVFLGLMYTPVFAKHIKGGFFTYKYLGTGSAPGTLKYNVTLTVYMQCFPEPGQLNQNVPFTIFDGVTNRFIRTVNVPISNSYELGRSQDDECITGNQSGCYYTIVVYDLPSIELPSNANGYTFSYQRCCRIPGVENLQNSGSVGNTYSITIPGSAVGQNAQQNSSAAFSVNDTYVVCRNNYFTFPFLATDADGDELTYSFCNAWTGGTELVPAPDDAAAPPYSTVPYQLPFNGSQPLGSQVSIDPKTGLISGIAPNISGTGEFVVTVCVNEFRNGVLIAKNRKELHIRVGSCTPVKPQLKPEYITCDGFNLTFINNNPSPEIKTYDWDFGDGSSSTEERPTHTYADTGTYQVKVTINKGLICTDFAVTTAKVYPGFFPDFTFNGICVNKPTQFTDLTTTRYGAVNSWRWDFGDAAVTGDTSQLQNPSYTYPSNGIRNVRFIAGNSKGCLDTVFKDVTIIDKPLLSVAFADTLICAGDNLQLQAIGNGNFSWTPASNITNENTATPTVSPSSTATYFVQLNDNGCINNDSVNVRVVSFVSLSARSDTTICENDAVQLSAVSNGLKYEWTPSETVDNPSKINAVATPVATTTYKIKATIGGCEATDDVVITLVPYPVANAGNDTILCYNTQAQLNGRVNGTSFQWSPAISLNNAAILNPVAFPAFTTTYFLFTTDSKGCPKPGYDSVIVTVLPPMNAFAGNDTAVVVGQPLQFLATGGNRYDWSPATALNFTNISDPLAIYDGSIDSIRYRVIVANEVGCLDSAYITVKVFKVNPQIFVPTAFTPNGDGKNDLFRPIAVGIKKIEYFQVYNRWGQLVFSTTVNGQGWDGKIGGRTQASNSYVWIVKGIDYLDQPFFKKGSVTLLR
jgi:gliding motility-associated-like protein